MDVLRLDGRALRVLAHPLRARLLSALRIGGPSTATRLAEHVGTNTGATSYHLRALAEVDLVVEDEGRGTGRERWWRAAQDAHGWQEADLVDAGPDAQQAASWLRGHYWRQFAESAARWEQLRADWPLPWRENAGHGDALVRVTATELGELLTEVEAVIARYHRPGADDDPAARTVSVHLAALPVHPEHAPES